MPAIAVASFYVKAAFSPDGSHIVSGSTDRKVYIWQVRAAILQSSTCSPGAEPFPSPLAHVGSWETQKGGVMPEGTALKAALQPQPPVRGAPVSEITTFMLLLLICRWMEGRAASLTPCLAMRGKSQLWPGVRGTCSRLLPLLMMPPSGCGTSSGGTIL